MTTATTVRPDPRPVWLRLLVWSGLLIGALISVPLLGAGLAGIGDGRGKFLLSFGLVLVLSSVCGVAREVAERRLVREPVQPRLEPATGGEPALLLPRATAPTLISSGFLAGLSIILALSAALAATERSWALCVVLALTAGWLAHLARPLRAAVTAGGLRLTPSSVGDDYRGISWEVAWEDVTGVDAHHPLRVLLAVRPDRVPQVQRTGPRGRAWNPVRAGNVLVIDSSHLAGRSKLAGDLIATSLADPAARRLLGTPESLPPA